MAKQPFENVVQHLFQIAARTEFKTLKDQELLKRYVEHRDELAFGELVRRYKGMIWYVCWRVLRQHQDVEDAFQATIMTLVRRARTILSHETIEGWLHSTAFKVANNARKDRERRHAREERIAKMYREENERHRCRWDLGDVLDKELTHIPEKLRSPLILCYLEGMTEQEAAERLGLSIYALESRLRRGREQLKKRLSKYGMELGSTMMMANSIPGVHVPEVPLGLVEKTLDMVRIMTLSNGALETTGISPQVAALVKGAIGLWTLKMKICVGVVMLSAVGASIGVVRYPGYFLNLMGWEQSRENKAHLSKKIVDEAQASQSTPRADSYGDPLPPGALARLGTVRFRDDGNGSEQVVITPDKTNSAIVYSGIRERWRQIRMWDLVTGKPSYQFRDSQNQVVPIPTAREQDSCQTVAQWAISLDGRLLAKCNKAGDEFRFWDMSTRKVLKLRMKEYPQQLAISPDGRTVAVLGDRYLSGWDSTTGEQKWKRKKETRYSHLVYNPDGKVLMSLTEGSIYRWEGATGKKLPCWTTGKGTFNFAWSRNGGTLAVLPDQKGNAIQIWNMETGQQVRQIRVEEKTKPEIHQLALSADGKILAMSVHYRDINTGKICLWNTATGHQISDWSSLGNYRLAFSCDDKTLVSVNNDHTILVWDVASGTQINQEWITRGYCTIANSVAFLPRGEALVSSTHKEEHASLDLWEASAAAGQCPFRLVIPGFDPNGRAHLSVAISPDGKIAASFVLEGRKKIGPFGEVRLWEIATGKEMTKYRVPYAFGALAFSPNGKFLACALGGTRTMLWDVANGKQLDGTIRGAAMAFFPDGKMLVTRSEKSLHIWETTTGKELYNLPKGDFAELQQVGISPDGRMLAVTGNVKNVTDKNGMFAPYSKVYLWHVDTSKKTVRLERPRQLIKLGSYWVNRRVLTFSPDNRMLATSDSYHPIIQVWEIATGQERYHFNDHNHSSLNSSPPSFSPDCRRLASGHVDTSILIWDLTGRLDEGRLHPARLSLQAMEAQWAELASANAARAARALWSLVAAGSPTVSFLEKRLQPIQRKPVAAETLIQLIADLDHNTFAIRKKAREELKKLGETAEASLRQALDNKPSLELRRSIEELLKIVEEARDPYLPPSSEVLRSLRAIEVLEQIGTSKAQRLLEVLSQGATGVRQTLDAQSALIRLQQVAGRQKIDFPR